jgi:hypothetical protein
VEPIDGTADTMQLDTWLSWIGELDARIERLLNQCAGYWAGKSSPDVKLVGGGKMSQLRARRRQRSHEGQAGHDPVLKSDEVLGALRTMIKTVARSYDVGPEYVIVRL